jgi:ribonucleotide monophosphatase NagD (HAD superfamily)
VTSPIAIEALLDAHAGVLLDAYGVLIDARGALPGAATLVDELHRRGLPWAVVTNDASRSATTYAGRFEKLGLRIPAEHVITSGSLLPAFFRTRGLAGARTCVLGPPDSEAFVVAGGGVPVPLARGMEIDALAVCDDAGFVFLEGLEISVSAIIRACDAGRTPTLVLPNPDLVYPKGAGELGVTAGGMALVIEAVLARRYGAAAPRFVHLGKPNAAIFDAAVARLGLARDRIVMIGDQLETDIAGARGAGLRAALVAGVSRLDDIRDTALAPHYLLTTIEHA